MKIIDTATALLEECPALADARQPRVPRFGRPIDPKLRSWSFDDAGWRRRLVAEPDDLVGPIVARGGCLAPVIEDGARVWIDPTIEPIDGDLVMVQVSKSDLESLLRDGENSPAWRELMRNQDVPTLWLKQLQHVHGWPFGVSRKSLNEWGAVRMSSSRVLGVVRLYRDPQCLVDTTPKALQQMLKEAAVQRLKSHSPGGQ